MRLRLWSQWPTPGVLQLAALRLSFARGQHLNRAALAADWVSTEYAGSPLAGRDLHPLDGKRNFMESSQHPPIPIDQQCLVAL